GISNGETPPLHSPYGTWKISFGHLQDSKFGAPFRFRATGGFFMNAVFHTQVSEVEIGNESHPFVSVIIPVYNEEAYIAGALRAVLEQDYPSDMLEVIVADGLSTDGTRKIIGSFQGE